MDTKVCYKCNNNRNVDDFYNGSNSCKICARIRQNQYYKNNSEKVKNYIKEYVKNNKDKVSDYQKRYYQDLNNRNIAIKRAKEYYDNNKEEQNKKKKIYSSKNKEKLKMIRKIWYENNIEKMREYHREYTKKNKYYLLEKASKRKKERRKTDHAYRLYENVSSSIRNSLKQGGKGNRKWESLVGYTIEELRIHLEIQFLPGMTWENHGSWHIDHKRPVSSFNITDTECQDFKDCWSLSNLQPLWKKDNLEKGSKWNPDGVSNNSKGD